MEGPQNEPQSSGSGAAKDRRGGNRGNPRDPITGRILPKGAVLAGGEAAEGRNEEEGLAPAGPADQLEDMRHVYERSQGADRTQGQRECRKWLKQDRKGFMQAKTRLEEAALKAKGVEKSDTPAAGPVEKHVDLGADKCIELAERLLASEGWKDT